MTLGSFFSDKKNSPVGDGVAWYEQTLVSLSQSNHGVGRCEWAFKNPLHAV